MNSQGSDKWFDDRRGNITASRFEDVMAKGKGCEFGQTAYTYAYEIIAEKMTGQSKEFSNIAMEWGTEHEADARTAYQRLTFNLVKKTGYIALNDYTGGSPDGLIGVDGGLEIKCPYNSSVHVKNIATMKVPTEYIPQVQGYIWITGRKWWDFVSYDPRFKSNKLVIITVKRDENYIKLLSERVNNFKKLIDSLVERF